MFGLGAAAGSVPRGWSLSSTCALLLAVALALCSLASAHDAGEVTKRGFLFHDDDAPYSLPMDIYVPLVGLNGTGARSVKLDAAAMAQSLFNSLPTARPSCLQNGRHLHAQYLLNYHVYHTRSDVLTSVERLLAEHMRPAMDSDGNPVTAPLFIPAPHSSDGLTDAMYLDEDEEHTAASAGAGAASGAHAKRGERPGQHMVVPVFDIELSEIEAALDGIVVGSLEAEMRAIGIDTQTHRPFHESGVVILNPDKERMRDFMRPSELVTLKNPLDADRPSLPFVYRYRYNGGAPTKQWIGYGRHAFMDLTAMPTSFGGSTTGEGTVGRETIPQVETALDHKVSSSLHSPEEIVELYSAAEAAAARQGNPGVAPSTRFASRLASATLNAVRKVFVADVRFSKIEYAERIVVPIIVLRNHEQFSPFTTDTPLPGEDGRFDDMKIDLSVLRFELKQMLLPSQDLVITTMTRSIYDHRHLSSSVFNALTEDTLHSPAAGAPSAGASGYVARTVPYLDSEVLINQLVASSSSDALLTAVIEEHRAARTRAEAEARAYRATQDASLPGRMPHPDEGLDEDALAGREAAMADADAAAIERTLAEARKGSRNSASSTSSHVKAGKSLGVARDRRKAWDKQTDKVLKSWQHRAYADSVLSGSLSGKQRVIPVFVYSLLGLPEGVLLDRTHLATPSARGSIIIALQTLAAEVPAPFFTEDGPVTLSARNPTREIVGSLVSAIGGVVPPYVQFQPEKKRLVLDYTWAVGQHAFGPFASTTAMSQVFQDAVLRNSVMTRLSGTVKLVKTAVHEIARFHRHFIADPLAAELSSQAARAAALAGPDAAADATALMAMGTASATDAAVMGPDAWFASLKQYRQYAKDASGAAMAAFALSATTAAISPFAQAVLLSLVTDLERLDKDLQAIAPLLAEFKWDAANTASAKLVSRALAFRHKVDDEISAARYELSCCRKVYSVHGDEPSLGTLASLSSTAAAATAAAAAEGGKTLSSVAASAAAGGMERIRAVASGSVATAAHVTASIKATSLFDQGPLVIAGVCLAALLVLVCVLGVIVALCRRRSAAKGAAARAALTAGSVGSVGSGGTGNNMDDRFGNSYSGSGFGNNYGASSGFGGGSSSGFGNTNPAFPHAAAPSNVPSGFDAAPASSFPPSGSGLSSYSHRSDLASAAPSALPGASPSHFSSSYDGSASEASSAPSGSPYGGRSYPVPSPTRTQPTRTQPAHSLSSGPVPSFDASFSGSSSGFGSGSGSGSSGFGSNSGFGGFGAAAATGAGSGAGSGAGTGVRPTSLSMSGRTMPTPSSAFGAGAGTGMGMGQLPPAPPSSSLSAASTASSTASSTAASPTPAFPAFPAPTSLAAAQSGVATGPAAGAGVGASGPHAGFGPGSAPMPPLSAMHAQYSRPLWSGPATGTAAAGASAGAGGFGRPAPFTAPAAGSSAAAAPAPASAVTPAPPTPAFAPFPGFGHAGGLSTTSTAGSSRSGPSPSPGAGAIGGFPTPSLPAMVPRSPQQPMPPSSAWPPSATSNAGSAPRPFALPQMPSFAPAAPAGFASAPAQNRSLGGAPFGGSAASGTQGSGKND